MSEYDRMRALVSDRPIAFHASIARLLGGVNACLFFQQIAFWSKGRTESEPGFGAWIWKTRGEMEEETALTRWEQEGARRKLRTLGVMEEVRRGVPARMHYRIHWRRFFELLNGPDSPVGGKPSIKLEEDQPSSRRENLQLDGGKPSDSSAENPPTVQRCSEMSSEIREGEEKTPSGDPPEEELRLTEEQRRELVPQAVGIVTRHDSLRRMVEEGRFEGLAGAINSRWPHLEATAEEVEDVLSPEGRPAGRRASG